MGGLAFADETPPLPTPRMPPSVYSHVRDHLLAILATIYAQAKSPIEAPAKADYGDIDILVAGPLHDRCHPAQIAAVTGAVKHKKTAGSQTTHFAIPWPEESKPKPDSEVDATNDPTTEPNPTRGHQLYIQLDLHVCTPESFSWEVFHQSHGDFWNIIGSTVRSLGLTPSNTGLYVRIEEIEAKNRNAARLLLTTSPSETLKFLGLDESRYWQKFDTANELFVYAATCRFFNPKKYDPTRAKGDLKSNDRARLRKRALFRSWAEEYLPLHVEDHPADPSAATMVRKEVVEEATRWFGVVDEYEVKRRDGVREIGRDRMWTQIRKELDIAAESVGAVMRGVKREVNAEGQLETTIQRAFAEDDFDLVVQWARENWKEIEQRQRELEKEKSTKILLAKLDKMRAEGKAGADLRLGKAKKEEAEDQAG